ncbi:MULTISPECIES: phage major capsid protein [unclassified Rhodococcus (in: high G+C Gram-positive bacteria)]|uniref:phage major capsid protein n=1 Tax=unclassified Rhodococcus (in: high G+C Gram-positive bacteria) TaxID=192944 RepID=UPI00096A933C|nr:MULTISPECIES: phage major capsid protein [unclassified Rhodococcus (in: high G+C Gram-positive bacteria)]
MIDIKDPRWQKYHGMPEAQVAAEAQKVRAEAHELAERSELQGADADRFEELADTLEYFKQRNESRNRLLQLANDPGTIEAPQFEDRSRKETRAALEGLQVLERAQSVEQWSRENGHSTATDANFDNYLRGIATGNWKGADAERALAEGTQSAGGYLVPTPLSNQVIDLARNQLRVIEAGAITVPMTAQTLRIPRLMGEGTAAWRLENAALTASDLTFDAVTFKARSLDRLIVMSRELFEDSNPSASNVIAQAFAAQLAAEIDRVALRGTGVDPQPLGLLNTAGVPVTNHGANGTALPDYDWILDSIGTVRQNNFEPSAVLLAPRSQTKLSKIKDTSGRYLDAPSNLPKVLTTNQVPTNLTVGTSNDTSEIYVGDFSQLAIGIRTGFSLRLLTERYADNGQVAFIANIRADVQVLQPKAFAIDLGVRP